jgi:hypothetical protein
MVEGKGLTRKSKLPPKLEESHAFVLVAMAREKNDVKWDTSPEEVCNQLAACIDKTAVASDLKQVLHKGVIASAAYDAMVFQLTKRSYVEYFQAKVDGKLKRCIRSLAPYSTEPFVGMPNRPLMEQAHSAIAAAGPDGMSLDELMQRLGLYVAQVRCAFSYRNLHLRMPLDPTHVRLKQTCV